MSALNCKPGDLVVVVKGNDRNDTWCIGRIVRCDYMVMHRGFACWMTLPKLVSPRATYIGFADVCLRPIRDPGNDARDETLTWLTVPSTTKEAA